MIKEKHMTSFLTNTGRVALGLLTLGLGLVAAGGTFFVLAGFANRLWPVVGLAALALLLVSGGLIGRLTHRPALSLLVAVTWLVMTAGLAAYLLAPLPVSYQPPSPLPGMQFWELETGSRIAYTRIAAVPPAAPTPVIFLHGGPGWLILDSDIAFYGQLAEDGFDVYLYDQIGSGRSARLADLRQYSTERHVTDLEAIRRRIDADQVILIGQSWGNTLAADYMAAYPAHVARVIFASPGALWDVSRFKADYSGVADVAADQAGGPSLPPLRVLVTILLAPRNPLLARQIVSERDLESYFDTLPAATLIGQNYCRGDEDKVPDVEIRGANQYVNRLTFASQESYPDPRPALRQNRTPALILRGECEFLPWEVAYEYRETLPNATLLSVPDAGHALYGAQPDLIAAAMRAFLLDRPLPLPPYTANTLPVGN
jgi:pimeloyl-ACP methyl ester carboxylesterase